MTPTDCEILWATWEMCGFQASMFPECFIFNYAKSTFVLLLCCGSEAYHLEALNPGSRLPIIQNQSNLTS